MKEKIPSTQYNLLQIVLGVFTNVGHVILKFTWKWKKPRITKIVLLNHKEGKNFPSRCQNILKLYQLK